MDKELVGSDLILCRVCHLEKHEDFIFTLLKIDLGIPVLSNGQIMFQEPTGNEYYVFNAKYNLLEFGSFFHISNNQFDSFVTNTGVKVNYRFSEFEWEEIQTLKNIQFG